MILKTNRIDYENIRGIKDIILGDHGDLDSKPEGKFYIFLDQVTDP